MVAMPSILSEQLDENDPMRNDLGLIGESASRAAAVVQDLLALARREKCNRRPMWLNSLVSECLDSPAVEKLINHDTGIELVTVLDEALPPIQGSESHLMQAILNVVINGIEAMKGKSGQLRVSTGVRNVVNRGDLLIGCDTGNYVSLAIEDEGCGISSEQLQRILEPFFSSKPMGNSGSGLGLAVVYGILEDHQAGLKVESEVDGGTCFEIYFPISVELPDNEEETEPQGGTERVLVIDDVDAQRILTERLLRSHGYTTDAVDSGRAAIERVQEVNFDAVVLDMIMEDDFDGLDTYREIRRIRPATRCVIATGFSESVRVKEVLRLGASSCLRKPFSRVELCRAVRDALDHTPEPEVELVS
jgi:CheY-like chemotaxis protein